MKRFLFSCFFCVLFISCVFITPNLSAKHRNDDEIVSVGVDAGGEQQTEEQRERQEQQQLRKQQSQRNSQTSTAAGIKIKNPRNYGLDYYWWSGTECIYQGKIHGLGVTATNSYIGHTFIFTKEMKSKPKNPTDYEFARITVAVDVNLYILPPEEGEENEQFYLKLMEEKLFTEQYLQRTGRPWLAHYPRDPPIHHIWSADFIGEKHTIVTNATHWLCLPESNPPSEDDISKCHPKPPLVSPLSITLEVISIEPKIFLISNTLSDIESDLIISLAKPKIKRSLAGNDGGLVSNTRTSSNAWLSRKEHFILDTIYRRAADMVNISDSYFVPGGSGNIVEDMQVVNYQFRQEYTPHHDFGADGRPNQRYITLLFYLNNQISSDAGGETAFPKSGLNPIHAGKGNSVMFYSLLEDGNADDLTLHAGTPVIKGEKWLANFWVWDPKR